MQGKIFGIPLVLILLVFGIAGLVDIPMYYMGRTTVQKVNTALVLMNESNQRVVNCTVAPAQVVTPKPVPTVKAVKLGTSSAIRK